MNNIPRATRLEPFDLSARQLQVLELAAQGLNREQMAQNLGIANSTVPQHLKAIYRKLGVPNRTAAVALALTAGIVNNPPPNTPCCPRCGFRMSSDCH